MKSAKYDDVLKIRTRISDTQNRTISFSYEVLRESDNQILASGETVHVICGKNGRPKILPDKYRAQFAAFREPQAQRSKS